MAFLVLLAARNGVIDISALVPRLKLILLAHGGVSAQHIDRTKNKTKNRRQKIQLGAFRPE